MSYQQWKNGIDLDEVEVVGTEVQVKSTVDLFGQKRSFIGEGL